MKQFMILNTKLGKYTFENEAKTNFYDKISSRKYSKGITFNNNY